MKTFHAFDSAVDELCDHCGAAFVVGFLQAQVLIMLREMPEEKQVAIVKEFVDSVSAQIAMRI